MKMWECDSNPELINFEFIVNFDSVAGLLVAG